MSVPLDYKQKALIDKLMEIGELQTHFLGLATRARQDLEEVKKFKNEIEMLISEKTKGFPWLASAIARLYEYRDLKIADLLENKVKPARLASENVRAVAREKRVFHERFRVTLNLLRYYEALFPWLQDFVGEDVDDLIKSITQPEQEGQADQDPVKFYLTEGEYKTLSSSERNQRALDRYWSKKKSSWELGRDYERYVGYLYEKEGYAVQYQGIEAGLEDLGRDLIVTRGNQIKVIQCKYWAQHKVIHEKHICQLFGTALKFWVEKKGALKKHDPEFMLELLKKQDVSAEFVTSTTISDVAKEFAHELGIEIREKTPLEKYPSIKCNIAKQSGEKIYHLPLDQQYDRTIIEKERNESYIETVAEAERLGFRRAWRWRGAPQENSVT